jgi:KTSC domain
MRSTKHVSMKPVFSSHVNAVGYDDGSSELHIEYKNGKRFIYKDVDPDKARQVMNGASVGQSLHKHIRGQHDHEEL